MRERGRGTGNMGEGGLPRGDAPGSDERDALDPATTALVRLPPAPPPGKGGGVGGRVAAPPAAAGPARRGRGGLPLRPPAGGRPPGRVPARAAGAGRGAPP